MIALFGFGQTAKALLEFCNSKAQRCVVFDDTFQTQHQDDQGNLYAPSQDYPLFHTQIQIPSPGIPPTHPLIIQASCLVGEYDYLLSSISEPQIWISGTNGKTTTTQMLEWILAPLGAKSGGNIGVPLSKLISLKPKYYLIETSSFSLHYTQKVSPQCYLLLPLREDHLSWHGSFQAYIQDKLSPLERMGEESWAFIPQELHSHKSVQAFRGHLVLYKGSKDLQEFLNIQAPPFAEPFLLDAFLALCGVRAIGEIPDPQSLRGYQLGAHKIQEFKDKQGRIWVDDSKATNVDATLWAIRTYEDRQIYLILGGEDKGVDLKILFEEMQGKKISIFAIGKNTQKLMHLSQEYSIPAQACHVLHKAVEQIHLLHTPQSIALLSPAAASLDQFRSYQHRGEEFKRFVLDLS